MTILALLVATVLGPPRSENVDAFRADMGVYLSTRMTGLQFHSQDIDDIARVFANANAPADFTLPPGLHGAPGLMGCRVLAWNDRAVSLICFQDENGQPIHLLVIDRSAFPDLSETPQFALAGDWMTATWTRDRHAYLMAGQGAIHRLL